MVAVWEKRLPGPGPLTKILVQCRDTGIQEALISWTLASEIRKPSQIKRKVPVSTAEGPWERFHWCARELKFRVENTYRSLLGES
jgi:hypothetical protein